MTTIKIDEMTAFMQLDESTIQKKVERIDNLLIDSDGFLKPVPAQVIKNIPSDDYRMWCHFRAVYGYPTLELVEYLKKEIYGRRAIEVGSGNGSLAKALGILATDNKCQERPEVISQYSSMQQPLIKYGNNVRKIDAVSAVKRYKPDIVIAMWVTHKWRAGEEYGNVYGVEEEKIVKRSKYIFIGNDAIHYDKRIFASPHKKEYFDWLISRRTEGNFISTWDCKSKIYSKY